MTNGIDVINNFINAINSIPTKTFSEEVKSVSVRSSASNSRGEKNYESDKYRKRTSVNS